MCRHRARSSRKALAGHLRERSWLVGVLLLVGVWSSRVPASGDSPPEGCRRELGPSNGRPAPAVRFDFRHACLVDTHRHHGSSAQIVFDGNRAACILEVLLNHGQARARAAYIALHRTVCRGHAEFECALLVVDPWPLVRESDRVSAVEDGDDRLGEMGVDEVFHELSDDHE